MCVTSVQVPFWTCTGILKLGRYLISCKNKTIILHIYIIIYIRMYYMIIIITIYNIYIYIYLLLLLFIAIIINYHCYIIIIIMNVYKYVYQCLPSIVIIIWILFGLYECWFPGVTSKPSTGASRLVEVKHRRWQSESIPGPSFRQKVVMVANKNLETSWCYPLVI